MRNQTIFAAVLALGFAAVACSSSGSSSSTGSGGAGSTATSSTVASTGTGPMTPPNSCTKPGDKGNDIGVGEYCTPNGGECGKFPKAGLCLADVQQDQWFCTKVGCKTDMDCGMAAHCHMDPAGAG